MTIIEPKKSKLRLNPIWLLALGFILVEAVLSVYIYSQNVRLFHELRETEKSIEDLRISAADFKSQIYGRMESESVDRLAGKLGLIKERNPEYFSLNR